MDVIWIWEIQMIWSEKRQYEPKTAEADASVDADITAIFGISGYYETTIQNYICSLGILILCGCISAILLKNLNHRQRKKANE